MRALLDGVMLQLRSGMSLEILPNEQVGLFGGDFDGLDSLSVSTIGRHDYVVAAHTGERLDLTERQLRQIGHGGEGPSTARARRVVRGMCQRPDFDGTIEWVTAHPNNAPIYFGA
jgi:hypothetical protein